jgi:hypothetical protein
LDRVYACAARHPLSKQVHQMGYLTDLIGSRAVDVVNAYAKSDSPDRYTQGHNP